MGRQEGIEGDVGDVGEKEGWGSGRGDGDRERVGEVGGWREEGRESGGGMRWEWVGEVVGEGKGRGEEGRGRGRERGLRKRGGGEREW